MSCKTTQKMTYKKGNKLQHQFIFQYISAATSLTHFQRFFFQLSWFIVAISCLSWLTKLQSFVAVVLFFSIHNSKVGYGYIRQKRKKAHAMVDYYYDCKNCQRKAESHDELFETIYIIKQFKEKGDRRRNQSH